MDVTNLVSVWEGEDSGNLGVDSVVASANDLTNTNTVTQTTGKVGSCPSFASASSQSLRKASNASLQVTGSFSFGLWVKMTSLANFHILTKFNAYTGSLEYALTYENGYGFRFFVRNSTNTTTSAITHASGTKSTATWYYLTGVYDLAVPRIYINVNAGTRTDAAGPSAPRSSTNAFCLGSSTQDNFFNGQLDQAVFFKRALSTTEEAELYNSGNGLSYAAMTGGGGATAIPVLMNQYRQRRS